MSRTNFTSYEAHRPSILLVRDDAVLPPALATEDKSSFLPGWRAINNFDEYALRRTIRETNWSFLHLRAGKETGVKMGRARHKILQERWHRYWANFAGGNSMPWKCPCSLQVFSRREFSKDFGKSPAFPAQRSERNLKEG